MRSVPRMECSVVEKFAAITITAALLVGGVACRGYKQTSSADAPRQKTTQMLEPTVERVSKQALDMVGPIDLAQIIQNNNDSVKPDMNNQGLLIFIDPPPDTMSTYELVVGVKYMPDKALSIKDTYLLAVTDPSVSMPLEIRRLTQSDTNKEFWIIGERSDADLGEPLSPFNTDTFIRPGDNEDTVRFRMMEAKKLLGIFTNAARMAITQAKK